MVERDYGKAMCPGRDNGCEEEKGGEMGGGCCEMTKESEWYERGETNWSVRGWGEWWGRVRFSGRAGPESGFTVVLVVQIVRVRDK